MTVDIEAIAVVVPAHDEEELLDECLAAVELAALAARGAVPRVLIWVVLDACSDGSAAIAARHEVVPVVIDAASVGIARRAGTDAALAAFADIAPDRLWIAHTDADSVVPPHWLVHQARLAASGADVVVGTVRPDFRDLTPEQAAAWWATHTPGVANGHVHGANLGVRASALVAAGGIAPLGEHEDVVLVDALRTLGAEVVASDVAWVRTSGRQTGRTAGGYARYLREDLIRAAGSAVSRPWHPVSIA